MKPTTAIVFVLALLIGLVGGYLLFSTLSGEASETAATAHEHSEGEVWTCSMHPQIQQPEPGDCPICGMDLIPLPEEASTDPTVLTMTEAAVAMARVQTTTVGPDPLTPLRPNPLPLSGRLAPDERTTAVEVTDFGGRIERLFVGFAGEQVRAGQRIATVYSPDLTVAQEELLQARSLGLDSSLVDAARARLHNLKLTEAQIRQIEETGAPITDFPVYADENGTITEMRAEVGQYLPAGGALYTYTDLNRLWALFDAYEDQLASIDVGDRVSFTVNGQPDENYSARISFIDPIVDAETRTAAVRAEVDNRRGRLKAGMFIRGQLYSSDVSRDARSGSSDELLIPATAILWTGERSVVYVKVPDAEVPTYAFREVELGQRVGDSYRVLSGLEAGEGVVTQGAFQIDAAAQLRDHASMMNRDVFIRGRKAKETTAKVVPDYKADVPDAFRTQLGAVAEAYLLLKDAMVTGEVAGAGTLDPLAAAMGKVDMSLVRNEAHQYWMQQLEAIEDHLGAVAGATGLEEQRKQFSFLSQALISALTTFGVEGDYYVQHCPMAFDGAGANWISDSEAIRNPYYGDEMLTCGSVIETIE